VARFGTTQWSVVETNSPSTNLPIVTIAAPDAIAAEGTN
jgi:hypothetical protein